MRSPDADSGQPPTHLLRELNEKQIRYLAEVTGGEPLREMGSYRTKYFKPFVPIEAIKYPNKGHLSFVGRLLIYPGSGAYYLIGDSSVRITDSAVAIEPDKVRFIEPDYGFFSDSSFPMNPLRVTVLTMTPREVSARFIGFDPNITSMGLDSAEQEALKIAMNERQRLISMVSA